MTKNKLVLIDCENLSKKELLPPDIEKVENLHVLFFINEKCHNIPANIFYLIQELGGKISWEYVPKDNRSANCMDFYITAHIGIHAATHEGFDYVVVSHDKGFDNVLGYIAQKVDIDPESISRTDTLSEAIDPLAPLPFTEQEQDENQVTSLSQPDYSVVEEAIAKLQDLPTFADSIDMFPSLYKEISLYLRQYYGHNANNYNKHMQQAFGELVPSLGISTLNTFSRLEISKGNKSTLFPNKARKLKDIMDKLAGESPFKSISHSELEVIIACLKILRQHSPTSQKFHSAICLSLKHIFCQKELAKLYNICWNSFNEPQLIKHLTQFIYQEQSDTLSDSSETDRTVAPTLESPADDTPDHISIVLDDSSHSEPSVPFNDDAPEEIIELSTSEYNYATPLTLGHDIVTELIEFSHSRVSFYRDLVEHLSDQLSQSELSTIYHANKLLLDSMHATKERELFPKEGFLEIENLLVLLKKQSTDFNDLKERASIHFKDMLTPEDINYLCLKHHEEELYDVLDTPTEVNEKKSKEPDNSDTWLTPEQLDTQYKLLINSSSRNVYRIKLTNAFGDVLSQTQLNKVFRVTSSIVKTKGKLKIGQHLAIRSKCIEYSSDQNEYRMLLHIAFAPYHTEEEIEAMFDQTKASYATFPVKKVRLQIVSDCLDHSHSKTDYHEKLTHALKDHLSSVEISELYRSTVSRLSS